MKKVKPKFVLTVIDRKGPKGCHHGHKVGDSFDFESERQKLCPLATAVGFLYVNLLHGGGKVRGEPEGTARFCCPEPDTLNIFKVETVFPEVIESKQV